MMRLEKADKSTPTDKAPSCAALDAPGEITRLLVQWAGGDRDALDQVIELVYPELRRIAKGYMARERDGQTLDTGALVNEAYLRLVPQERVEWTNRKQFYVVCALLMRRTLVDYARRRAREGRKRDALATLRSASVDHDHLALDLAFAELERCSPRQSEVAHLKFYVGLTVEEIAELTRLSPATVKREWRLAKLFLGHELGGPA